FFQGRHSFIRNESWIVPVCDFDTAPDKMAEETMPRTAHSSRGAAKINEAYIVSALGGERDRHRLNLKRQNPLRAFVGKVLYGKASIVAMEGKSQSAHAREDIGKRGDIKLESGTIGHVQDQLFKRKAAEEGDKWVEIKMEFHLLDCEKK
ncbi:hypothetical protein BGZ49_003588, partial [Haplosporangium sp. Z 27]